MKKNRALICVVVCFMYSFAQPALQETSVNEGIIKKLDDIDKNLNRMLEWDKVIAQIKENDKRIQRLKERQPAFQETMRTEGQSTEPSQSEVTGEIDHLEKTLSQLDIVNRLLDQIEENDKLIQALKKQRSTQVELPEEEVNTRGEDTIRGVEDQATSTEGTITQTFEEEVIGGMSETGKINFSERGGTLPSPRWSHTRQTTSSDQPLEEDDSHEFPTDITPSYQPLPEYDLFDPSRASDDDVD